MKTLDHLFIIGIIVVGLTGGFLRFHQVEYELAPNPMYTEFDAFAQAHGLDLTAYEKLKPGWRFQPNELSILNQESGSVDILLVGDSSVNYGVAPEVIEQVSGKRVAVFAYPALTVTTPMLQYIDTLANRLLSEDGVIVFMFDPAFWNKGLSVAQENQQLDVIFKQSAQALCLYCKASLRKFTQKQQQQAIRKWLNRWLGLASINFYDAFIEPWLAPRQHTKKFTNDQGIKKHEKRFFIAPNHILIVKDNNQVATHKAMIYEPPAATENQRQLVRLMNAIKHQKILVLPLSTTTQIHQQLQQMAAALADEMAVLDLAALIPKGWVVPMQNRTHTANLGIIQQSLVLGQQLKEHWGQFKPR